MPINRKRLQQFRAGIDELQRQLSFDEFYKTIRAQILESLSADDGRRFKQLTAEQQRRFIESLFRPEHQSFVNKIFETYNDVIQVVNDLYGDLGVDISRDFQKVRAIEKINRANLGDYEESSIRDIQQVLRRSLIKGDSFKEVGRQLKTLDEKVVSYADTIARTQVKGYARLVKSEKARIAEVFFYEYTGAIRRTTRPFCLALIGKTLHIDTINKMRNGNKEPVRTYCGGWNCHHDLEPDPFAKKESDGEWQEVSTGRRSMKVYSSENVGALVAEYENTLRSLRRK